LAVLFEAFFIYVNDDGNRRGLSCAGGQQGVVNSIMKEVSKGGFGKIYEKKEN
jgi:hypothetical protein